MHRPAPLLLLALCALALFAGAVNAGSCGAGDRQINTMISPTPTCAAKDESAKHPDYQFYCMPSIAADCATKVNAGCLHCKLYWEAADAGGTCARGDTTLCEIDNNGNTIQIASADVSGKKAHWKVVPSKAIRGTEDLENAGNLAAYDALWQSGWNAVHAGALPSQGKVGKPSNPAMVINSPATRTDHQMHIHIAQVNEKALPSSKPSKFSAKHWEATTLAGKSAVMSCPEHKSTPTPMPFSSLAQAIELVNNKKLNTWATGDKLWYATTVALVKPSFCKGAGTCDYCVVLGRHVGDKEVLLY